MQQAQQLLEALQQHEAVREAGGKLARHWEALQRHERVREGVEYVQSKVQQLMGRDEL